MKKLKERKKNKSKEEISQLMQLIKFHFELKIGKLKIYYTII